MKLIYVNFPDWEVRTNTDAIDLKECFFSKSKPSYK